MKDFRFVDLFCGGGGSISGAINALKKAGQSYDGRGFNHWETAIRLSQPLPTITALGGHLALINPIFIDQSHPGDHADGARCKTGPLGTVTTSNNWAVVRPMLIDQSHTKNAGVFRSIEDPLNTITCSHGTHSIVQPLFIPQQSGGTVKPIVNPVPTIATGGAIGYVEPFIMEYYGNGITHSVSDLLPTITTHDRFGIVKGRIMTLPDGRSFKLDITHRMLTSMELADATGFAHDYIFAGSDTDAKKQIGNAVCPNLGRGSLPCNTRCINRKDNQ